MGVVVALVFKPLSKEIFNNLLKINPRSKIIFESVI